MSNIEKVGIVGFGAMGQLMADKMFPGLEVLAHDPNLDVDEINGVKLVSLSEVAQSDAVVTAVPGATNLLQVARELASLIPEGTLLVDVSSVKVIPELIFSDLRENGRNIGKLLCHPLFGPQSASKGLNGHRIFVTKSEGEKADELVGLWSGLGLNIIELSAEEHDKLMVAVQAIPFAIGRMVAMLGLDDPVAVQTPSRLNVRKLEWLDEQQSDGLLKTIIRDNPFAKAVLAQMLENGLSLIK